MTVTKEYENIGLFGASSNAVFKNIGITGTIIVTMNSVRQMQIGGLVGHMFSNESNLIIDNCFCQVYTTFTANDYRFAYYNIGGIVGTGESIRTIRNSYNEGNISIREGGAGNFGGIWGAVSEHSSGPGSILLEKCFNTGNIDFVSKIDINLPSSMTCCGGLVGGAGSGLSISECYNTGDISIDHHSMYLLNGQYAGGLVGRRYSSNFKADIIITNSFNTGNVRAIAYSARQEKYNGWASSCAGGLIADFDSGKGTIENSYNSGSVVAFAYAQVDTPDQGNHSNTFCGGILGECARGIQTVEGCAILSDNLSSSAEKTYCHIVGYCVDDDDPRYAEGYRPGWYSIKSNNYAADDISGDAIFDADVELPRTTFSNQSIWEELGFDFDTIWKMPSDGGYPVLQWQDDIDDTLTSTDTPTEKVMINYNQDYNAGMVEVNWGASLFKKSSGVYNHDLALVAAALTSAASGRGEYLRTYQNQQGVHDGAYARLGLTNDCYFNYSNYNTLPGSNTDEHCFSIASGEMIINGEENLVIAVVLRGTESEAEGMGDGKATANKNFGDYLVFDYFLEYADKVWDEFNNYIGQSFVREYGNNIKVLIAGHSLGGAAANLLAAKFKVIPGVINTNNIYAYTFGALNTIGFREERIGFTAKIKHEPTIPNDNHLYGYIHNIFNFWDTFGPEGEGFDLVGGLIIVKPAYGDISFLSKFGKILLFDENFREQKGLYFDKGDARYKNHVMACYVEAIDNELDSIFFDAPNIYTSVLCPVDVDVLDSSNKLVGRIQDDEVDKTATTIPMYVEGDKKFMLIPANSKYTLEFSAYDDGVMEYYVETTNTFSNQYTGFVNISLVKGKLMSSDIGGNLDIPNTKLYVIDSTGNKTAEILPDGTEVLLNTGGNGNSDGNTNPNSTPTVTDIDPITPTMPVNPFADVFSTDWFIDDVIYVYDKGIMTGTSTEPMLFSPRVSLSRAMVVTTLYRHSGSLEVAYENQFTDVSNGEWYTDAIIWATANNIVNGYGDGKFGINDPITRQDFATILMRYMSYLEINLAVPAQWIIFADEADISDYAMDAIQTLFKLGIINGTGTNADGQIVINPKGNATRAEAAALLHRYMEKIAQ